MVRVRKVSTTALPDGALHEGRVTVLVLASVASLWICLVPFPELLLPAMFIGHWERDGEPIPFACSSFVHGCLFIAKPCVFFSKMTLTVTALVLLRQTFHWLSFVLTSF